MRREWDEGEFTCVFELHIAQADAAALEEQFAEERRADEHFAAQQQAEDYAWSPADEAEAILSESTLPDIGEESKTDEPPPPPHDTDEGNKRTTEEKLDAAQVIHGPAEPWKNGTRWMLKHCFLTLVIRRVCLLHRVPRVLSSRLTPMRRVRYPPSNTGCMCLFPSSVSWVISNFLQAA